MDYAVLHHYAAISPAKMTLFTLTATTTFDLRVHLNTPYPYHHTPICFMMNAIISINPTNHSLECLQFNQHKETLQQQHSHQLNTALEEYTTEPSLYNTAMTRDATDPIAMILYLMMKQDFNKALQLAVQHKHAAYVEILHCLTQAITATQVIQYPLECLEALMYFQKYDKVQVLFKNHLIVKHDIGVLLPLCIKHQQLPWLMENLQQTNLQIKNPFLMADALIRNHDYSNALTFLINHSQTYNTVSLYMFKQYQQYLDIEMLHALLLLLTNNAIVIDKTLGLQMAHVYFETHHMPHGLKMMMTCGAFEEALYYCSGSLNKDAMEMCCRLLIKEKYVQHMDKALYLTFGNIFKQHGFLKEAALFYLLNKDYKESLDCWIGLRELKEMVLVASKSNMPLLVDKVMGELKDNYKRYFYNESTNSVDLSYIESYKILNKVEEEGFNMCALLTDLILTMGDYIMARDIVLVYIHQTTSVINKNHAISMLMLCQAYISLKWLIKNNDDREACWVLMYMVKNINKYEIHKIAILTSAMLHFSKQGMKKEAFDVAQLLIKLPMNEQYKKKIESIARKPTFESIEIPKIRCQECGDENNNSILNTKCVECGRNYDMCILTYQVVVDGDICMKCHVKYVKYMNVKQCIICNEQLRGD